MQRRQFISRVLACGFAGSTACWVTGCGTLLHSERQGQPHSNQIDWKMAALDGLGLLLFFVPGVVAFAVDFCTGAIYLPMEPTWQELGLKRVVIPREELQQQRIEQVVAHHVGQPVSLDDSQTRLSVLSGIERFDEQASRHRADRTFGLAAQSLLERLKHA